MRSGGVRRFLDVARGTTLPSLGIIGLVGFVAIIGVTTVWQGEQARSQDRFVRQAVAIRTRLKDLTIALLEAETGQRGYVLTGRADYLAPYQDALVRIPALENDLDRLTARLPAERGQLDRLVPVVQQKLAELAQTVQLRTESGEDAAKQIVLADTGQALMDQIAAMLDALTQQDEQALDQRMAAERRARITAEWLSIAGAVVATVFLVTAALVLRRTLARLQRSEASYRLLADNTSDLITRVNLRFERTYVSPASAAMLGFEPDEIMGQTPALLVHPDDLELVSQRLQALAAGRIDHAQATYRMHHKRGHWVWTETRFTLVRDELTGAPRSIVASLRDISERRANTELERLARHLARARDQADQANRAKSRFLASMSHELRTPLNSILGCAQLLKMQGQLGPVQQGQVDAMLQSGQHLLQMINRVLDFSEVETRKVHLEPEAVDPQEVARAAADIVRPLAAAKGLPLELTATADVPGRVWADAGRLRQVLVNLLGNAVKFTSSGLVQLHLLQAGNGGARFEVADTGPGIPKQRQSRLFHEFERLDAHVMEGAGLGLAISANILRAMGGSIGYKDNPGGGSLFWLELPPGEPVPELVPPPAAVAAATVRPSKLHLLVVDDVAMNREITSAFLLDAGHEVMTAEGGAEAAEKAASEAFDAILMDVRMPEVDGLEATRRIRALPGAHGRVPIIAVTAQTFADQIRECRRAGMDAHLAKPFTQAGLVDVLARVTGHHLAPAPEPSDGSEAPQAAEPTLPIFDAATFERTAAFLEPDAVADFLQTLKTQGEALLADVRNVEKRSQDGAGLAAAAHRFAGSAEMFGFQRVGAAARAFERAVQTAAPDLPRAADHLAAALDLSFAEIPRLQARPTASPAKPAPAPEPEADLPVFDRDGYEGTASFLAPESIATFLQALSGQAADLQARLGSPQTLQGASADMAAAAHRFAGSAEMFGFRQVAAAARRCERAITTEAPELTEQVHQLSAALDAFFAEMGRLLAVAATEREPIPLPVGQ
ncbi:MAG: CHASE3 domain-containing protein [Acetobacteraceae bacterium]|nr:CHASE3 domain-containing protein [Acetobacteraceae bacterium]